LPIVPPFSDHATQFDAIPFQVCTCDYDRSSLSNRDRLLGSNFVVEGAALFFQFCSFLQSSERKLRRDCRILRFLSTLLTGTGYAVLDDNQILTQVCAGAELEPS
jgi:hypothetical protein